MAVIKWKREYGTNGNNGTDGISLEVFRLFRYFRLFRILFDEAWEREHRHGA
jgi:hypothetical protein